MKQKHYELLLEIVEDARQASLAHLTSDEYADFLRDIYDLEPAGQASPCEWCKERAGGTSLVYDIFHEYFSLTGATEVMSFSHCPNCGAELEVEG